LRAVRIPLIRERYEIQPWQEGKHLAFARMMPDYSFVRIRLTTAGDSTKTPGDCSIDAQKIDSIWSKDMTALTGR
jgi:hypothetical protein